MNSHFRAISFDIDGTLVFGKPGSDRNVFTAWFDAWLNRHGRSDFSGVWQQVVEGQALEEVVKKAGLPLPAFLRDLDQWAAATHGAIEGAARMLELAKQSGREVHLASTNASTMALAKLRGTGLDVSRLSGVRGGDEVIPGGKSSPGFYQKLAEWIEIPIDQIVHIGDDATADAKFSLEAGIGFCLLIHPGGELPDEGLAGSDRLKVCRNAYEVAEWIQQLDKIEAYA